MSAYNIHKILVPIDLSETSLNALDTAIELAGKHNAAIELLHVVENNFELLRDDVSSYGLSNSTDVIKALAGSIQNAKNVNPEVVQVEGNVAESIISYALANHCSLIVMGSHGASGFRDGFIGSNTYRVMKHAHCPVLSIPLKNKYPGFKRPLFPIRPVAGALSRYDVLCHFLAANAHLDVLGLSYRRMERETNVLEKIMNEIRDELARDRVQVQINWNAGGNIPDDILQFSQENNSDLIVVTSVLDVTTKPGFIGPHSQKIINGSKVPVLNIRKLEVPSWV